MNNKDEYPLTQGEQRYVERLRQLQSTAVASAMPQVLTVVVTNSTLSFFDGKPAGTSKNEDKRP